MPGICAKPGCKHWDKLRTAREQCSKTPRLRTIKHRVKQYAPSFRSVSEK